ncbi:nucleotide sugar dehydrogenase [Kitasatospora aureofaciens]|uniref:nucleotide sugar dehydrogenase n=1 Tax=Kitasatospora aureofaciens TaxID=1894 RepID=UPI001C43E3C0|nr:nucleotide sugar dehydrogenase [Kitasatospora aureofaciens]MBV6699965.1 nucleotide sugar dehydrogenase [Kitasatospora aureofaciens]
MPARHDTGGFAARRPRASAPPVPSAPSAASVPPVPSAARSRVIVAGQGYVGLSLAARAAEAGHRVVGFDVDERRVEQLIAGESYVVDIPSARLRPLLASGAYSVSTDPADCAGFDIAVITVPTPLREGLPDLSHIAGSARMLGGFLRPGALVVLESTTYPGTTDELVAPILAETSGLTAGRDFHLGYSPERIDPGNTRWSLENTPKVVSGVNRTSLEHVQAFYRSIVRTVVPVSGCRTAELTKLLENTFRHVNIGLVNELAMFAHELDVDVWEAIDAATTKPYGYLRFVPGPGVGGHCLPIDPSYLSWWAERTAGRTFRFVELANDVNSHMPDYVVQRLVKALDRREKDVKGSRVLLLGISYKANTSDTRETPSARVAELLLGMGADVYAADPHVVREVPIEESTELPAEVPDGVRLVTPSPEELAAADAVVLLTDHDAFDYDTVTACSTYVLDCRRRLSGDNIEIL